MIPFLTNQKTPSEQLIDTLKNTNEALSKLESKLTNIEQAAEKQTAVSIQYEFFIIKRQKTAVTLINGTINNGNAL